MNELFMSNKFEQNLSITIDKMFKELNSQFKFYCITLNIYIENLQVKLMGSVQVCRE